MGLELIVPVLGIMTGIIVPVAAFVWFEGFVFPKLTIVYRVRFQYKNVGGNLLYVLMKNITCTPERTEQIWITLSERFSTLKVILL